MGKGGGGRDSFYILFVCLLCACACPWSVSLPGHTVANFPLVVCEGGGDWTSPLPASTVTLGTAWFSALSHGSISWEWMKHRSPAQPPSFLLSMSGGAGAKDVPFQPVPDELTLPCGDHILSHCPEERERKVINLVEY